MSLRRRSDSNEPGQIQFNIPFLKAIGFPQPIGKIEQETQEAATSSFEASIVHNQCDQVDVV